MKSSRLIDLTNQKFRKLVVIGRSNKKDKSDSVYWDCKCDCGEVKAYRTDVLRKTNVKSCGCTSNHVKIGDRIGKLEVVERLGRINNGRSIFWRCVCDCGSKKDKILSSHVIREGFHKSCGCLRNPHGENHPNYTGYKDLSGRFFNRIKIGAEKRNILFKITKKQLWDLFEKQNRKCALSGMDLYFGVESKRKEKKIECSASLDRVDNKKGYIKNNIQWVHKDINIMKRHHSQEYFINICKLVARKVEK